MSMAPLFCHCFVSVFETAGVLSVLLTCIVTCRKNDWRGRVEHKVRRDRNLDDDDVLYSGVADSIDGDTRDSIRTKSCVSVCRIVDLVDVRTYQQQRQLTQRQTHTMSRFPMTIFIVTGSY